MRALATAAASIAVAAASASIITEKNNVFVKPPPASTFSGSNARPGIQSRYIPYGTFKRGNSSQAEVMRLNNYLYGVVFSAYDGLTERYNVWAWDGEDLLMIPEWYESHYGDEYWQHLLHRSAGGGTNFYSNADSSRIVDWLNGGYEGASDTIESVIYSRLINHFGSRMLDDLAEQEGMPTKPEEIISTEWRDDIPFSASDAAKWRTVWPLFASLKPDGDIIKGTNSWEGNVCFPLNEWSTPSHLDGIWGKDVHTAATNLWRAVQQSPNPFTAKDVLSYDTGFPKGEKTNDYYMVSGPLGTFNLTKGSDTFYSSTISADRQMNLRFLSNPDQDYCILEIYVKALDSVGEETWMLEYEGFVSGQVPGDDFQAGEYYCDNKALYADNAYTHWFKEATTATTRFDWTRLGLICQMERQMETTYKVQAAEDTLPQVWATSERKATYESDPITLTLPTVPTEWRLRDEGPIDVGEPFQSESLNFTKSSENVKTNSVRSGRSFPTARVIARKATTSAVVKNSMIVPCLTGKKTLTDEFTLDGHDYLRDMYVLDLPVGDYKAVYWGSLTSIYFSEVTYWCPSIYVYDPKTGEELLSLDHLVDYAVAGGKTSETSFDSTFDVIYSINVYKTAAAMHTLSDTLDMHSSISNFVAYPHANNWANRWVYSQTRPALEVLISAKGYIPDAIGEMSFIPLSWDSVKNMNGSRKFRMSPEASKRYSLDGIDRERFSALYSLNSAVHTKFNQIAPVPCLYPTGGDNYEIISEFESGEATKAIRDTVEGYTCQPQYFGIVPLFDDDVMFDASFSIQWDMNPDTGAMYKKVTNFVVTRGYIRYDDGSTHDIPEYSDEYGTAYLLAGNEWDIEWTPRNGYLANVDTNTTPKGAYVDGRRDQMIKTEWRFKNLRDPEM